MMLSYKQPLCTKFLIIFDPIGKKEVFFQPTQLEFLKKKLKEDGRIVEVVLKSCFLSLIDSPLSHKPKCIVSICNSKVRLCIIWIGFFFLSSKRMYTIKQVGLDFFS